MAAFVMAVLALVVRADRVRGMRSGFRAAVAGLLLHGGLLGGTFYALADGVSTAVAAVVIGLQPVLVALLAPTCCTKT